jgi:hypothetical protein
MLLIGSKALSLQNINLPGRNEVIKDIDFIGSIDEAHRFSVCLGDDLVHTKVKRWGVDLFAVGSGPIEIEYAQEGSTGNNLLKIIKEYPELLSTVKYVDRYGFIHDVSSPNLVFTLKMSHRYLKNSKHFLKCMNDIKILREKHDCKVPDCLKEWLKEREAATYDYDHPSLNQSKQNFFSDDGVGYIYDHDSIHEAVKIFEIPAFEMIKKDKAEVFCSKEKFTNSSKDVQLATVLEECYVLALERSQIPYDFSIDRKKSFNLALEKVCTSIASGWWREFAWENYYAVRELYNDSYVDRFKKALKEGRIKPYKEG